MRSAEAAAADIFAQAMNTPSTEPLAKGRSEPEPKDEISFFRLEWSLRLGLTWGNAACAGA